MDDLLKLTNEERGALEAVLSSNAPGKEIQRAQALLLLDENEGVTEIAQLLRVSRQTVYNWVERFQARRPRAAPERLRDAPRDGRPATVGEIIDELLDGILETGPRHFGYRSTVCGEFVATVIFACDRPARWAIDNRLRAADKNGACAGHLNNLF
jgi:hypothetical protein